MHRTEIEMAGQATVLLRPYVQSRVTEDPSVNSGHRSQAAVNWEKTLKKSLFLRAAPAARHIWKLRVLCQPRSHGGARPSAAVNSVFAKLFPSSRVTGHNP